MVSLRNHFKNILKLKEPLTIDQIKRLAELGLRNKEFKILPGREKVQNRPIYMVIWYKNYPVAEVFTTKVQELPVSKVDEFNPEDYVKVEKFLKKIKSIL